LFCPALGIVPVVIVPVTSCKVGTNLVICFCIFHNGHVDVNRAHTFGMTAKPRYGAYIWHANLRETAISFTRRTASVGKYNGSDSVRVYIDVLGERLAYHMYSQNTSPSAWSQGRWPQPSGSSSALPCCNRSGSFDVSVLISWRPVPGSIQSDQNVGMMNSLAP